MALIEAPATETSSWVLRGHQAEVLSLVVAPAAQERCLVSGDRDGSLFLWNTIAEQQKPGSYFQNIASLPGSDNGGQGTAITQLAASNERIFGSSASGAGKIWDLQTCKPLRDLFRVDQRQLNGNSSGVVQNAVATEESTGVSVFGGDDRILRFFSDQLPIATVQHKYPVTSLAISGTLTFVGGPDGLLHCYDLAQRDWLFHADAHQDVISSIAVSHDRKQVATRGFDGGLLVWSLPIARPGSKKNGAKNAELVGAKEPQLFSARECKPSKEWRLPRVAWGPGDGFIATGELKELHAYSTQREGALDDLGCLAAHGGEVVDVAVSTKSNTLFCSSSDALITASLFAEEK